MSTWCNVCLVWWISTYVPVVCKSNCDQVQCQLGLEECQLDGQQCLQECQCNVLRHLDCLGSCPDCPCTYEGACTHTISPDSRLGRVSCQPLVDPWPVTQWLLDMEESTLALAQSLARQTIYEESPPGSPKAGRSHAQLLQDKVQGFR